MITTIEIQGLRGIREGRIEGLAPLTILVGPNGCGKSTVLEACGVACAGSSPAAAFQALASREWLGVTGIRYWFGNEGAQITAELDPAFAGDKRWSWHLLADPTALRHAAPTGGVEDAGPFVTLRVKTIRGEFHAFASEDGNVYEQASTSTIPFALQSAFVDRPAGAVRRLTRPIFSSAHREALTAIKLTPWYDELFSYLQILRSGLISVESIAVGDRDEPHIFERDPKHGRQGYPMAYAGDGFRRSLLVAGTFARAKGGIAALDEPEAFAHPAMLEPLTGLIKRAVSDGTQVVLATHSLEFVAAALQAFEDQPDKAVVVGLRMESGVLDPVVVTGADARRRVLECGDDLRL